MMKKLLLSVILMAGLSACGPQMYSTRSGGLENSSFIVVLAENADYDKAAVSVEVDGKVSAIEKVYKTKAARKAIPIVITPGKHKIKVIVNGSVVSEESIFLGLRETKKIVLK